MVNRLTLLFDRYMAGSSSAEEAYEFMVMANDPVNEQQLKNLMEGHFRQTLSHQFPVPQDQQVMLQQIFTAAAPPAPVLSQPVRGRNHAALWKWLLSTAAVLLLLYSFPALLLRKSCKGDCGDVIYRGALVPATSRATLTLSNGKKVALLATDTVQLSAERGWRISRQGKGKLVYRKVSGTAGSATAFNTITTPAGGTYQVVLPDGTKVWLNASSSLRYPLDFATDRARRVTLSGEAYFEVAKQRSASGGRLPFFVRSRMQEVEVLGTHFNISAYPEAGATLTTLLEGSVNVHRAGLFSTLLHPGQQSRVAATVQVNTVDTSIVVAWKNGLFKFDDAAIATVMDQFSRWYDVDIVYEGKMPAIRFNGEIYRNMEASRALQVLGLGPDHFKVIRRGGEGGRRKIIIYPPH